MNEQNSSGSRAGHSAATLPAWIILPLRLFLGGSFLLAGLDKLGDPSYLDPAARDYIGRQIANFAPGTPLAGFLLNVAVPNATLFGVLVMGGELLIGVAVLLGLVTRLSALLGMLLNLTFFLSATWDVHPFYFGADLPYTFGWLTLLLAGPGMWAFDTLLQRWLHPAQGDLAYPQTQPELATRSVLTRRAFLGAGVAGLASALLAATGLGWGVLHPGRAQAVAHAEATPTPITPPQQPSPTVVAVASSPTPELPTSTVQPPATEAAAHTAPPPTTPPTEAPTAEASSRVLVAVAGDVPAGQGLNFLLPTGEPAVLVHNTAGYSAYVAICTHQGCTVHLNSAGVLKCPCHGAEFDAAAGSVLRGPARRPLSPVALTIDPDGSVYLS